jgi:diguanylate cyclase (GGDEF)-like protein
MRESESQRTKVRAVGPAEPCRSAKSIGDCGLGVRCDSRLGRNVPQWRAVVGAVVLLLGALHRAEARQAAPAQTTYADTVFQHLDERDGLATPAISAFAQDGDGFLWVGTQGGMSRWDGYHFRNYQAALGVPGALPDDLVQALYGDPQGRLWVGTNGGLALYDRERDQFITFPAKAGDLVHAGVWAIVSDGANGLWIGTPIGLAHLDIASGHYTNFHPKGPEAAALVGSPVRALLRDASGSLWVGTDKGLFRGDEAEKSFTAVALPQTKGLAPVVWSLCRGSDGRLWLGTDHGALVMDAVAGTVRAVEETMPAVISGERVTLQDEPVEKITEAGPGVVWLGTHAHGIVAVDTHTFKTHRIVHDVALASSLAGDSIQALYRDREGVVWVGTLRGVNRTDPTRTGVFTFSGDSSNKDRIADGDVYAVLAEPSRIWLGLGNHGVDLFDLNGARAGALRPDPSHPRSALPKGHIQGLADGRPGTVYIGSEHGLYQADQDGQHLERVRCSGTLQPNVRTILYQGDRLWVGARDGLWELDAPGGKGGSLRRAVLREPLTDNRIRALAVGVGGRELWVATEHGLNRIDQVTREVERILPDPSNPTALAAGFLSSLLVDHQGRLWVSTFGGGINLLEGSDSAGRPRFRRLVEGLPNANIDVLLEGPDGRIWASTDAGIISIDPQTFKIQVLLQQPDGVAIAAYWNNSGAVSKSMGMLLFGGLGGLTAVRPARLNRWDYIPPVVVTDARIGGRQVSESAFNQQREGQPVTIAPDANSLMVEFAALDYTAPQHNRYAYRLDGFDQQWITTDPTRRLASYTNLPPGNYQLELRGSNRVGAWGKVLTVKIRVLPAWYQTIWAKIAFALAGLLLLAGGFQVGTAYLRARQRALEELTAELQESKLQLEQLAYSDSLTGLPNRRMFNECFRRLLALKQRQKGIFALLVIDLDAFKQINDTHGHDVGDAVLVEVARRLTKMVRASDCFARVGGDEFFMLLSEPGAMAAVEYVCGRMVAGFAEPVVFRDLALPVTVSIGAALYPNGGETQDSLYKSADLALYRVKRDGGNGWHLQDAEMEASGQLPLLGPAD